MKNTHSDFEQALPDNYELTIHLDKDKKNDVLEIIRSVLPKYGIDFDSIASFDGEYSSYLYIDVTYDLGQKLSQEFDGIEGLDGFYLKPKGSPPEY